MGRPVKLLSFEGPDRYSMVGGLGTRETEFAQALCERGDDVELFFIGDPAKPAVEDVAEGLRYRRWCQWISAYHPAGVYDGESGKVDDFTNSIPPFVADAIAAMDDSGGERTLVIAEEWQTASAIVALDALLRQRGLRDAATLLWNANNTYGFERVDWPALRAAATITTVSRYMKFELAHSGQQALVVPNGIPSRLLAGPPQALVKGWRRALGGTPLLVKVGRFDPDKRWIQAIDAVAELLAQGRPVRLLVRGGREPYGDVVLARAQECGLRVGVVTSTGDDPDELFARVAEASDDVIVLRAFLPNDVLYALYAAADAVLANSGKEPFGLVGLEVMAAGGLAVCGATGEEYAVPFDNAIVVDTDDGRELAGYVTSVLDDPHQVARMRRAGHETAGRFTWEAVLATLDQKAAFAAAMQG